MSTVKVFLRTSIETSVNLDGGDRVEIIREKVVGVVHSTPGIDERSPRLNDIWKLAGEVTGTNDSTGSYSIQFRLIQEGKEKPDILLTNSHAARLIKHTT